MTSSDLEKSLIDYFKEIPDEGDASGKRHSLWLILHSFQPYAKRYRGISERIPRPIRQRAGKRSFTCGQTLCPKSP